MMNVTLKAELHFTLRVDSQKNITNKKLKKTSPTMEINGTTEIHISHRKHS